MRDPEPDAPQEFKEYVASRGWTYRCEWQWPWTDPETGEEYAGYWMQMICREELLPSGDIHFRALDLNAHLLDSENAWSALVDLAQAEFDHQSEKLRA